MTRRRSLQRLARRIGILCSVIAAFWLLLLAAGLTLPMASLQHPVEAAAASLLGQHVEITGGIRIRPTLGPTLVIAGVQVRLDEGADGGGLLRVERVEARLGLLSLLQGRPRIVALAAQGIRLELDNGLEGLRAWLRARQAAAVGQPVQQQARGELESLVLRDLQVSGRSAAGGPVFRVELDELSGSLQPERPLQLKLRGMLRQQPFVARIGADPVDRLLAPAGAWRMRGTLKYAAADLKLTGLMDVPLHGPSLALEFDLLGGRLPLVDSAHFHGRVELGDSGAVLSGLTGTVGETQLAGSGSLAFAGARPQLRLDVTVLVLDARGLRGGVPRDLPGMFPGMVAATMASPWLQAMTIDAAVQIHSIAHARVPVKDAGVALQVRDGNVTFPLWINIAGVMLQGSILPEGQGDVPGTRLVLRAEQVDAAEPVAVLTGYRGLRGQAGTVELHAVAAAAPGGGSALAAEMRLDDAEFSYGNLPGQQPVAVSVDRLRLHIPAANAVTASLQGRLRDIPVDLALSGGVLDALLQGREWPVTLTATGAGARLGVEGEIVAARGRMRARLNADLSGKRLGGLAPWLGVSPCATAAYRIRGQFIVSADTGHLQFVQARLGDTRLNADLDWTRDEAVPFIHTVVKFDELVPGDLKGALQFIRLDGPAGEAGGLTLEMPLLPAAVQIRNADFSLNVAHIDLGPLDVSNLTLASVIEDARLQTSPFAVVMGDSRIEGYLESSQGGVGVVWSVAESDAVAGSLLDRLFSNALQWVGNAGRIPLRSLFSSMLDAGDCAAAGEALPEP